MLATLAGASSSSLATTPSGSTYDMSSGAPPPAGGGNKFRKRSKSRSTQGDFRLRLTADQKCDIASKEIEELRDKTRRAAEDSEHNFESYKAVL